MTSSPIPYADFDLGADVPRGRTALEASAGTGKTFSIAGLVVRYVAEGAEIGQILVVTFTRTAAAELRDRIRTQLVRAYDAAASRARGSLDSLDDPVLHCVLDCDDAELGRRVSRLELALADFDTASIGTIHSFAQNLLAEQGLSATSNPDATLTEDTKVVLEQGLADVLANRGAAGGTPVSAGSVRDGAAMALQRSHAQLRPTAAEVEHEAADRRSRKSFRDNEEATRILAEVVGDVVARVRTIQREQAVLGFDDLLSAARDLVVDPVVGRHLVDAIRSRVAVALIDEFQDTDGVQWQLLETLFGNATLITVGDPKQSIYRFRGADVNSYLAAVRTSGERYTLATNWRSDRRLLSGARALFDGATFGNDEIAFVDVKCADDGGATLMVGDRCRSGVEVRFVPDLEAPAEVGRVQIAADLTRAVVELLDDGTIPDLGTDEIRRVVPRDIAILVKGHAEAPPIQRQLTRAKVPSVVGKVGSVLGTEAASQLLTVLRAVASPASQRRVRAAALGWFFGQPWDRIADGDHHLDRAASVVADLQTTLSAWADTLEREGLNRFFDELWQANRVAERLLAGSNGERNLTDLNHIRELLQQDGSADHIHRLVARFEVMMSEVDDDEEVESFARRTESDDNAVQIMTVHASKGLEFPVVIAVGLHTRPTDRRPSALDDPEEGRTIMVPSKDVWPDAQFDDRVRCEVDGEMRRLIYVAVTRAAHRAILFYGSARKKSKEPSALDTLLFGGPAPPNANRAVDELIQRIESSDGAFSASVIDIGTRAVVRTPGEVAAPAELAVATIDRSFDRAARRWSFTRISSSRAQPDGSAAVGDPGSIGGSGPEQGASDEATPDGLTVDDSDEAGSVLPLGNIAGGAAFGTLVHRVLELVDFAAADIVADLDEQVGTAAAWSAWNVERPGLTEGLAAAINTPLGPLFDHRPLRDFTRRDRLDEMTFELKLAPDGDPATRARPADVGTLIRRHLGAGDPLTGWAEELAAGAIDIDLAGHLTGAIDGIFRVRSADRPDRYVIVDYKTNRLGTYRTPLQLQDYSVDGMAVAMAHHDYPLQALLYSVALHRYLRWRLKGAYQPVENLGGAAYLFVRGMIGPETPLTGPAPHGVFSWPIPPQLVVELSDLLHRGAHR